MKIFSKSQDKTWLNPKKLFANVLLFLILLPIFYIFFYITSPIKPNTHVLFDSYLKIIIKDTFIIVFFVMIFSSIIGVFLAYFECFYEYKFKRFFSFVLVLPFAVPSYLFAYIYTDFFGYFGWFMSLVRANFGINLSMDIMNIYGCIFVLTLAFFPYVYILLRGFLKHFNNSLIDSARSLGKSDFAIFFKVVLPLSKPCIIAGASLCMMETLNAYGAPNYFGLQVFSTGIYKAWIGYSDLNAAIKLASILILFVFVWVFGQKLFTRPYTQAKGDKLVAKKLSKKSEVIVVSLFSFVFFVSFLLPMICLFVWFYRSFDSVDYVNLLKVSKNTILLTLFSSFLIVLVSLFLVSVKRFEKGKAKQISTSLANIGYSIPGSVVAICMLVIFISVDNALKPLYEYLKLDKALFLTLSPVVLIYAYMIRFLSLSYMGVESALNKLPISLHEASLSLGKSPFKTFLLVDFKLIIPSVISAFILVFIEIIKELPLASMLSYGDFKTLSFEMDRYASDEQLALVSAPALVVVLICFALLVCFNMIKKDKK